MHYRLASFVMFFLLWHSPHGFADTEPGPGDQTGDEAQEITEEEILYSCAGARAKKKTHVSFTSETSLSDLVTWAMSFSCKNFLYRSELASRSPKIEIVAPTTMTPSQSWRLFLVALDSLGLTLVRKGPVLHIVESAQAQTAALPIRRASGGTEQLERLLVQPSHVSIDDAHRALSALLSKQGGVVALPTAGALLITDYGSHTRRMMELLHRVDRPGANEGLYVIPLQFADVEVVKQHLMSLLALPQSPAAPAKKGGRNSVAKNSSAPPSLIVADTRTGTLLLRASEETYKRALLLAQELDQALEGDDKSRMHIYHLQHADAAKLAATLTSLRQPASPNAAPVARSSRTVVPTSETGASLSGAVQITADVETNSLLVQATRRDFVAAKVLIEGLDRQRPQVFLEVTILEVDQDKNLEIGGSFHFGSATKSTTRFGASQHGGSRTAPLESLQKSALQDGLVVGALGTLLPTEQFLGVSIPSFGVLFQALAEDKRIDIISSPQIMTTNNTKATLSVGQNVPYKAGTTVAPGGVAESIKREDVEMTLEVTPHVNLDGLVRLEVELNIKELLPNQVGSEPSWTTREIVNTVVVADQESIAIGGLASEKESVTKSKVPLLGDLPLLGVLFRSSRRQTSKRNLLVLLTPHVITDPNEARLLTARKLSEREAFLRSFRELQSRKFDSSVDYRKKRGLLAEIRRAVIEVEAEAESIREMQGQWREPKRGLLDDTSAAAP
tara:strand:- start:47491 stop:49683 length:2193 start_codon:yes stop_codon:yes gene_type:complete